MASKLNGPEQVAKPLRMHHRAVTAGLQSACEAIVSPKMAVGVSGVCAVSGVSVSLVSSVSLFFAAY